MRAVPVLAWRLLRGSGRRGALTSGLSTLAVAISTALLLLTIGVMLGFNQRADRESWIHPEEATANPAAMMAVSTDFVRGEPIAIVDLAALSIEAPVPPGMDRFPQPGEVWVSPALADLLVELPGNQLAQRFEGEQSGLSVVGELGPESLVHPEQLMAVVGRLPADVNAAYASEFWQDPYMAAPTPISDFSGSEPGWAMQYQAYSAFAAVLLVVPLFVLGTAAGRLSTAQRDRRLAAMRLVGATPSQVVAITTFETVLIGAAGAVLGSVAYAASLPLAAQVTATGGTWFVGDLWVGTGVLLLTLLSVPLIVGASALVGLRALIISPLGVARQQSARGAKVWRLLLFVVLLVAYSIVAPSIGIGSAAAFAAFFGLLFLAISLMGPFVVRLLGYALTFLARGPETLLAGRRIVDNPFSVWRIVGGIALTGFVAGFLTIMIPRDASIFYGDTDVLRIGVEARDLDTVASQVRQILDEGGIDATVTMDEPVESTFDSSTSLAAMEVQVQGNEDDLDRARTVLTGVGALSHPISEEGIGWSDQALLTDIRSASVLVLTVTLAVAAASAAITGVTGVLDRRQMLGLQRLAGTPLRVLDSARLRESMIPIVLLGGAAIATGMICAAPLAATASATAEETAGITLESHSFEMLLVPVVVALIGFGLAELASRLTLRSVTSDPTSYR